MSNTVSDSSSPLWRTHAAFLAASSFACLVWSWYAGRDLNWDQLNYHFYSAYHFLEDRLERDFMGASIQGYLNPLGYVPFYLMVRANWPSLLIGSVLALAHSTCLWLIYGISRVLIPAQTPFRIAMIAASVALAFLAPIYLIEVGSSFIDVTTTIPILAGVLLLLICDRSTQAGLLVLLAGLLMGAASGLKLTNAIFAVAASVFIVLGTRPVNARIRDMGIYIAGGFAGFLVVEGAWAYQLFKTFEILFPVVQRVVPIAGFSSLQHSAVSVFDRDPGRLCPVSGPDAGLDRSRLHGEHIARRSDSRLFWADGSDGAGIPDSVEGSQVTRFTVVPEN
jgi:hypothetical protein